MVTEAIDSVLAQRSRSYELVVVDDGSEDGTADGLARYGSSLQVISQERKGVAAARNVGVSVATGRYVAFLDSDDLWLPDKLAIQMAFMEQQPEAHISQTEEIWIRRGVRVNPKAKHRKFSGDIFRPSLDLCLVSPSTVMMTRNLFDSVGGFDERLPVCEDYDLWLRISVRHRVPLIPKALVVKRGGHCDQLSRSVWGMDRYRLQALRNLILRGLPDEKRDWAVDALKRKTLVLSNGARKRGKEAEAARYEAMLSEVLQEGAIVERENSTIRTQPRFSSADAGTLAELESTR